VIEPERMAVAGEPGMDELARVACGRYGLPDEVDLQLYPLTENWTATRRRRARSPNRT